MDKTISIEKNLQSLLIEQCKKEKSDKNPSICSKLKLLIRNITVEPITLCIILPSVMLIITNQNLTLEKSCRVNLALGENICDALSTRNVSYPGYKTSEAAVQKLAANMAIWKNIMQSIVPATLLLFLGSWSDRHKKRKPCILNPILGEMFACMCILLCIVYFYELPVQINVLAESVPIGLSGGWYSLFLGLYSYISSITSLETRTVRIGAVHTLFTISFCCGVSLSGIVYEKLGFYGKFEIYLDIECETVRS